MPQSRLTIKTGALNDAALRELLVERFAAHGVAPERIQCLGSTPRMEHLAAYDDVDICLDPFPQNGGVSTWEALQVGVPVLAKLGNSNASRAAGAILSSIGLHDWVTDSEDAICRSRGEICRRSPIISPRCDRSCPAMVLASPSGNTKHYTRAAEAAYRRHMAGILRRKQQGARAHNDLINAAPPSAARSCRALPPSPISAAS